jgi:hypothetical protein
MADSTVQTQDIKSLISSITKELKNSLSPYIGSPVDPKAEVVDLSYKPIDVVSSADDGTTMSGISLKGLIDFNQTVPIDTVKIQNVYNDETNYSQGIAIGKAAVATEINSVTIGYDATIIQEDPTPTVYLRLEHDTEFIIEIDGIQGIHVSLDILMLKTLVNESQAVHCKLVPIEQPKPLKAVDPMNRFSNLMEVKDGPKEEG